MFTVYREAQAFARAGRLPLLALNESTDIHAVRNSQRGPLVSALLFDPMPPEPLAYLAAAPNTFGSEFFASVQRMLRAHGTGPGYLQQVLDVPLADAMALHAALLR